MPFDPDELANGMMKWLEHKRKPKPEPPVANIVTPGFQEDPEYMDPGVIYQNPEPSALPFWEQPDEPSPPPAEMPGSGLSIQELQEQIKALQEQLKEIRGNADIPMAPRDGTPGEPHYPLGPGRDAPELTPDERRRRDWDNFNRWRQGGGGVPDYTMPRRPRPGDIDPGFRIPPDPNAPDIDPGFSLPRNERPYIPHPDDEDIIADMPSWGPYKRAPRDKPNWENLPYIREEDGRQEKPSYENLPYHYKEPMDKPSYELLNGTGSPVEGLNLKVGRHDNNYTPSKVTPGKGASLN